MISTAIIKQVRYSPELLPDAWFGNLALNAEFAPPVLDVKGFEPYLIRLVNIQVPLSILVNLRARYDDVRIEQNTAAMLNALVGAWDMPARTQLYLNFFGLGVVAPFTSHYGLWVVKPTIADKMLFGINLTPDEQILAGKYGIADTVQKGLLPLPISQLIEREYQVVGEETHTRNINIAAINTIYQIEVMYARPGEMLVLTRIASLDAGANNVQIIVDRDNDANYRQFPILPLNLGAGGEVVCFIPATTQIRLTTTAAGVAGATPFRYTVQRVKITNILRARFGLVSKDEIPGDTWDKVLCGVL